MGIRDRIDTTAMNATDVYRELKTRSIGASRIFHRELLIVDSTVFDEYEVHFVKVFHALNRKTNYRTPGTFRHIHAIKSGSLVEIHYDFGNLNKFFVMAVPHFFLDMVPYFLYHLITFRKPYSIDVQILESQIHKT
ncbi:MAG: hypothetical protein Greene07147_630 [Parcubacteria group bacterium Greene0714_7]|nr:MAG: hypothetical protein Greene07147_630 [Parcubacteria group bacterium Greene0714_7]